MSQRVIAVTGGHGALGRAVVEAALSDGLRVAVIDHATGQGVPEGVLALGGGDLTDPASSRTAIDAVVASPDARREGFGQVVPGRLALMASQVSDAYGTKTRVDPNKVWNASMLPTAAELNVLPPAKK